MAFNNVHLSVDDMFVYWSELLGKPEESKQLVKFVDDKLAALKELLEAEIVNGFDVADDAMLDKLRELLAELEIDPYKIPYHDTTVGDALDELTYKELEGSILEDADVDKGRRLLNYQVSFTLNKPVKSLKIVRCNNLDEIIETRNLDVDTRVVTYDVINQDTLFKVVATDDRDNTLELIHKVTFRNRWYAGCFGFKVPTNSAITSMQSGFAKKDEINLFHHFDCTTGTYIYFAFPYQLHRSYDFFTNGIKDSDWV
jgi:hypothetical protein